MPAEGPESAGLTRADRFILRPPTAADDQGAVSIQITVSDEAGEQTFGTALFRPTPAQREASMRGLQDRALKWFDR